MMESPVTVILEDSFGLAVELEATLIDYGVFCKVRLTEGNEPDFKVGQVVSRELENVYFDRD